MRRPTNQATPDKAVTTRTRRGVVGDRDALPWTDRQFVTVSLASQVCGISPTSVYRMAEQGRLVLRRLAGRVLVETPGLIKLIESAEPWAPSNRGKAARAKRSELARANWRASGGAV
ncbi:hypothetical protein Msil_3118 [Methylocella silvestris BL2]|uniref:Helix-turn-helix domain-containing protein n=1 Tax=Methylocella silvestris (strain DSM 15510 / CIP 108128 / LMG 27833 / NCIMB 13906 / BL2) TaxID=395965 RepID=B8EKZ9_METSB|nr:hypothetical protein Msil_3118 [Methylocella silvestris BL2]